MIYKKKPERPPYPEGYIPFDPKNAPDKIDAQQFIFELGMIPDDMTIVEEYSSICGYIMQGEETIYVMDGDWIVYKDGDAYQVVSDFVFRSVYAL